MLPVTQVPSVPHPKSNPEILMPPYLTFPVIAFEAADVAVVLEVVLEAFWATAASVLDVTTFAFDEVVGLTTTTAVEVAFTVVEELVFNVDGFIARVDFTTGDEAAGAGSV
jgi:hypothetical protein